VLTPALKIATPPRNATMIRTTLTCCLALGLLPAARAQAPTPEPAPIKLSLHPVRLPSPVLRYHLLPEQIEQQPGNAAPLYREAIALLKKLEPGPKDALERNELMDKWVALPLRDLPRAEVRRFLDRYRPLLDLIDKGARRQQCDFDLVERFRREGIGARLAEIHPTRDFARLLALRARLEMAEGKVEPAVKTIQTGLSLARQVGEAPSLICSLVGMAIAFQMLGCVDELIQLERVPNLYWALTDLPRPFLDLRETLQGERVMAYGTFPGLAESAADLNAGPMTAEQIKALADVFVKNPREFGNMSSWALSVGVLVKHEVGVKALVAAGRPRDKVEAMPHLQVALLHALLEYDRLFDEVRKWQGFPYWQTRPELLRLDREYRRNRAKMMPIHPDAPLFPFAYLFLPTVNKVLFAHARLDRKIAALRCVEAVRLYAASHGGKLPGSLADVKDVPVPIDPVTGQPFGYHLAGEQATLTAPPPTGEQPSMSNSLKYEIVQKR
jgi:hypothetical protein